MAEFVKFDCFARDVGLAVHNLNTDTIRAYLTNVAPIVATHALKADIAEIAAGSGYTALGQDVQNIYTASAGTGTLACTDLTWTASGGTIGPFRYVIFYNADTAALVDPLIGYADYGSEITLQIGESLTLDFAAALVTVV